MPWVQPVFDRSQEDITNRTSKGVVNVVDMNRIEGNCQFLAGLHGLSIETKTWDRGMIPRESDHRRILGNIDRLRSEVVVFVDTPQTPQYPLNSWQKWNDAERILSDVYIRYYEKDNIYAYLGEIWAGQSIGVF